MIRFGIGVAICLLAGLAAGADEAVETAGVLRLPVERKLTQQISVAAAQFERGEFARASALLEQLWLQSRNQLAGEEGVFQSVGDRVLTLSDRLPADERKRFWERIESSAGDDDSLLLGSPLRAGFLAVRKLAARLRDVGDFELASAAFGQAARHPAATADESLSAQLLHWDLLTEAGGPDAVSAALHRMTPDARRRSLRIAGQETTVEAWLTRRLPVENALPLPDRPGLTPAWEWTGPAPGNLPAALRQASDDLRAQGLIRLSTVRGVNIGSCVVARTWLGLVGLDAASGKVLWETPNRPASDRAGLAAQQNNALLGNKLVSTMAHQFQTNTLLGSFSHDERTVYHIVENGPTTEPNRPFAGYGLEAVDAATGRRLWQAGGAKDDSIRQLDWNPRESSICAPPLVAGRRLYVLCERFSELVLFAVDRETCEIEWFCRMGQLLPDAARFAPRNYTAAAIVRAGELIVCNSSCGAVIAVDALRQRIAWASRAPVELWSSRLDPTNVDPTSPAALHAWREAALWRDAERIVSISPDSPTIRVLDERTGTLRLSIPRGEGLKLLGMSRGQIVVLEPHAVRAHDLATGTLQWRTVTGEVRGQGFVADEHVAQPLADGSVAILNREDGRRLPGAIGSDVAWGNLIPLRDGWLSCDEYGIQRFADVASQRKLAPAAPVEQAGLDLAAGDFDAVHARLQHERDEAALRMRRAADLAELHFHPDRIDTIRERWRTPGTTPPEQAEALLALAEASFRQHRLADAARDALDGLSLGMTGLRTESGESTRRVRWDRAFQGLFMTARDAADETERAALEQLLADRWNDAKHHNDPFALQRLAQAWGSLAAMRGRMVDDSEAVFLGSSLLSRELSLLTAANSVADADGLRAAWALREEWRMSGFLQDAADLDFRLWRDVPGRLLSPETTVRQRLADHGGNRLPVRWQRGPHDAWPLHTPRVTVTKDVGDDVYQTPVPIEAESDGLWDRLDVTVDRQGKSLRFTGDGRSGAWTVALPPGGTLLQQQPLTYQGWAWGRLLIVRVGTLLLAVAPWNEHGEPDARLIWSQELLESRAPLPEQLLVERIVSPWKRAEAYRILDHFGRDVGFVGPVRPGYLCYAQQGKLIAVETQTGARLWERLDVPAGAIPLGDDEHVALWFPERNVVEVLSAVDGRTLRTRPCEFTRSDVWQVAQGRVSIGRQSEELTLACHDLISGKRIWERSFPRDCLPIGLDAQTAAVVDPRGLIHLLDAQTGATLDEPLTADVPKVVERLFVSRDEGRWYLGVSGPVERSFEWMKDQPLNAFRRPLLHGPLTAIDRFRRQIVWRREIAGEPWLLDQNKTTPVLAQIFKVPPPNGGQGIGEGVLRLIDKRTGRDAFVYRDLGLLAYFSLDPQPDFGKFELRTSNTIFEASYAPTADD